MGSRAAIDSIGLIVAIYNPLAPDEPLEPVSPLYANTPEGVAFCNLIVRRFNELTSEDRAVTRNVAVFRAIATRGRVDSYSLTM